MGATVKSLFAKESVRATDRTARRISRRHARIGGRRQHHFMRAGRTSRRLYRDIGFVAFAGPADALRLRQSRFVELAGFARAPIASASMFFRLRIANSPHRFAGRRRRRRRRSATRTAAGSTAATGAPLLSDALAAFDCSVEEIIERHSHAIIIGRVEAVSRRGGGGALVYWRGDYDQLAGRRRKYPTPSAWRRGDRLSGPDCY